MNFKLDRELSELLQSTIIVLGVVVLAASLIYVAIKSNEKIDMAKISSGYISCERKGK